MRHGGVRAWCVRFLREGQPNPSTTALLPPRSILMKIMVQISHMRVWCGVVWCGVEQIHRRFVVMYMNNSRHHFPLPP